MILKLQWNPRHCATKRSADGSSASPGAGLTRTSRPRSFGDRLKLILAGTLLVVIGLGTFAADNPPAPDATNAAAAAPRKTLYTCGMHPWIIQDHPGNCPICGMKLEPVRNASGAGTSSAIAIDPATIQLMNIQTVEVTRGPLRRTIRTVGTIDYNETALADVTTKFKGWIEKLNVDATGQLVHRGAPLFEIYSPELYSAEAEYLAVAHSTNGSGSSVLRDAALDKLKFFDISDAQIAGLEKSAAPKKTLEILAPADGFVIEKNIVQGQMVDAGMKLYRLADLGIVWVYAQVYEQDLPYVQLGQEATVKLSSLPDREFRGRVTYIYPNVDEKTRTAKVRLEFENPGYFLKPGMFVSAQITAELEPSALLVPDSAVLRSGEKNTVFVALPGGKFDPRAVALGPESEHDMVEAISGLQEGERIVASGQFMLDSESQLREAIQKMSAGNVPAPGAPVGAPPAESGTRGAPQNARGERAPQPLVYVCPMPEHVSITYDHPGNCPICRMALVPVTPGELKQLQPGGKVLYYTCPMPEHASVHEDKPGKCPICGMTLIPVMVAPAANTNSVPANAAIPSTSALAGKQLYTCPMDRDVISDKPGQCPKCGMNLVPMAAPPATTNSAPPQTGSPTNAPAAKQKYFCPMHPEVVSDEPGKCPQCGMNLVPVE
jgi:RND family efflux transporter MFP subunit